MKKLSINTFIVFFVLILTMGTALAATTSISQTNWNWLQDMLLSMSNDIQQLKTTTDKTQVTTDQIFTITTETQQSTANIEQTNLEIQKTVEETNDVVKETNDFLVNTVFPEIKQNRVVLQAIIDNEATAWNKLLEIQGQLEESNDQLIEGQAKLQDSNNQLFEQITAQRQSIVEMKNQIEDKLTQLSTQVLPSMIAIHEEITSLQGKIGDANQETTAKLEDIESEMLNLDSDIVNLRSINDDRYAVINGKLDEIAEMAGNTQEILLETEGIKRDIANVRQYLEGDIKMLLENIDFTTQETQKEVKVVDERLEGIKYYLEQMVYPEIEQNKVKLELISSKQEQAWNDLVDLKRAVEDNSQEILTNRDDINSMGQEFAEQLYTNQIIIKQIDAKISELATKMGEEVIAKMDSLDKDTTEIKAELELIKSQTEGIGATQQEIIESLAQIKNDMSKVDLDLDSISRYSQSLVSLLDCKANPKSDMCTKLAKLTTAVDNVNTNTEELKQGQLTITNYLNMLDNTNIQIKEGVDSLRFQFNCKVAVPNDVCFRLTLVETYLKNLEKDTTAIKEYTEGMEEMKLDLQGKLSELISDADNTLQESQNIKQQIQELQLVTEDSFVGLNNKIQEVQTGVEEITTSGIKLDFNTFAQLQNIQSLLESSNQKVGEVDSYLKGEVIQKIEEVEQVVEETSKETQQIIEENTEEIEQSINESIEQVTEQIIESEQEIIAEAGDNTQEIIDQVNQSQEETSEAIEQSTKEVVEQIQESQEEVEQVVEETSKETQQVIEENTEEVKQEVSIDTQALSEQITMENQELFQKVEFEAGKTRQELAAEIKSSTNLITADLNKNSKKLDDLLQNWGSNNAQDIIDSLQNNMEQLTELYGMMAAFNETEKMRYEDSKGVMNSIKEFMGIFENTATSNYNRIQENISLVQKDIKETLTLNNQILGAIQESGEDDQQYDEIALLITQNSELLQITKDLNITTKDLQNKLSTLTTSIDSVNSGVDMLKQTWNVDTEQKILGKLNILDTKIDYLNSTDKQAELKELIERISEELGFNGKTTSAYQLIVKLEDKLVEAENSIKVKIELEGLKTREELEQKITEGATRELQEINENQIMLYELLNKVNNFSTSELQMVVENHRDNLLMLDAWLKEFNMTEQKRFEQSKGLSERLINLIGVTETSENKKHTEIISKLSSMEDEIQGTELLANQILTQVGTEDREELHDLIITLMDDLSDVLASVGNYTNADEIRLFKGRNYITITMQPQENTPEKVFAEIRSQIKMVEYYDSAKKQWFIYNPAAPFGNTLDKISAGKTYWITMKGDARLTIN